MRISRYSEFQLKLSQGELRDIIHDLTKPGGRQNKTNTQKFVKAAQQLLPPSGNDSVSTASIRVED